MKLIGGIWLILYGINKIKNSRQHEIKSNEFNEASFTKVVLTTLAITYANPHVYLDTVILPVSYTHLTLPTKRIV